jgi:hypothetical protein
MPSDCGGNGAKAAAGARKTVKLPQKPYFFTTTPGIGARKTGIAI